MIRDYLTEHTPNIPVFAEEMGGAKDATTRWIVDPIDGTTNFVQGIPHFAVSIALEWNGEIVVAVTYDPSKDELFSAIKGGGAFLNDVPMKCSDECSLEDAVLATGFPYYDRAERADELLNGIQPFLIQSRGIRRMGAATLDMAICCLWSIGWLLGNRLATVGCCSYGLLLIQEAGGVCTQLDGSPMSIQTPRVLSANSQPRLWDSMFKDMGFLPNINPIFTTYSVGVIEYMPRHKVLGRPLIDDRTCTPSVVRVRRYTAIVVMPIAS